ncbi:kinase-like domain-containing protein [Obelidium mucronatum]|nr:kinase-like domain-containing protein [Obelidium mucronatum]
MPVVAESVGAMQFNNQYEMGGVLGEGSYSVVKEAVNTKTGAKYAIKIINKEFLAKLGRSSVITNELDILKSVSHQSSHIAGFHDYFEDTENSYIVLDLCSGGDVFDRILDRDSVCEAEVADVIRNLLEAVAFLHSRNIVHRDIKPENIIFRTPNSNKIALIDFGQSAILTPNQIFLRTACGTMGYMAPEILMGSGHDKSVDMWSIGVLVYFWLSGRLPFYGGQELYHTMIGHYKFEPVSLWKDVSDSAKNFIKKCLEVNYKTRLTASDALLHPWIVENSSLPGLTADSPPPATREPLFSDEPIMRLGVGHECQYPWSDPPLPPHSESASPKSSVAHQPTALEQCMRAFDAQLTDHDITDWAVEDPDLMPTTDDWFLLHRFFTYDERAVQVTLSTDAHNTLETFYQQPAHVRLTLCSIAAHFDPTVSEKVALSYYSRARKAVFRALDKPSVKVVHTLYWINSFATWNGQPAIGSSFLATAIDMIIFLKLYIDPDDSPWLNHLNLSEAEREDRRRAFWSCFYFLKVQQSLSGDAIQIKLRSDLLKPPRPVTEPYLAFISFDSFAPVCSMYDLLSAIRKHHSIIPTSLHDILGSESVVHLNIRLLNVHAKIPIQYLLVAESPITLTESDSTRFASQFSVLPDYEFRFVLCMNLNAMASISLLNRPKMYLSGFAPPTRFTPHTQGMISTAINQSLESAHRICCFLQYLVETTATSQVEEGKKHQDHHEWNILIMHPLFEAMIVFWFVYCRMDLGWWDLPPLVVMRDAVPKELLRDRLEQLVKCVRNVSINLIGMKDPIAQCMEAMLKEFDFVEANGRSSVVTSGRDIEELVLGMNVVSLGGGCSGDDDAGVESITPVTQEAWAFLGLLGLEVAGGIRWKAAYEDGWRAFWRDLNL